MSVTVLINANLAERFDWIRHRLKFMYSLGHQGETLLGVWSGHDRIGELESFCANLSPLIRIIPQSGHIFLTSRLLALAALATAPYVMVLGDDDFLYPPALRSAVEILERDPSVACTQGRFVRLDLDKPLGTVHFRTLPLWQSLEQDPIQRFVGFTKNMCITWHGVYRRDLFIERVRAMDEIYPRTNNSSFFEFMGDLYTVIKGKFVVSDEIYMVRGYHQKAASKVLFKLKSPHLAPFFADSPDFPAAYEVFEAKVFELLASVGVDVDAHRAAVLQGMTQFMDWMRRSTRADKEPVEKMLWQIFEGPGAKFENVPQEFNKIMLLILQTKPADM